MPASPDAKSVSLASKHSQHSQQHSTFLHKHAAHIIAKTRKLVI